MNEQWRDVVGFEGLYQVSNLGRIRSVDRFVKHRLGGTQKRIGIIRKPARTDANPHLALELWKDGKLTRVKVHRAVAEAWIGPCPDDCEVCHGPGGQTDNRVSNLRYDSHSNNLIEAADENHAQTRRVKRSDGVEFVSIAEALRNTPHVGRHISAVCKGKRESAGGFGWEYVDD